MYRCSKCSTPAKVTDGLIERGCGCAAPIVAEAAAGLAGAGGVR